MITKSIKTAAFLLSGLVAANADAQVCRNVYPYADGVVFDNNGHDLRAFIKSNTKDVAKKSVKIYDFSNGHWGYLQVNNARVPSINIRPALRPGTVSLNHSEYIDATLALFNTKDGIKATWWARQCNNPQGPLFYKKTDDEGKLDADNVRYEELSREMATKDFTIVEYNDSTYNDRDYAQLLRNFLIIENLAVKDINDYKTIIEFYNTFLTKFSYIEDPLLEDKSFITCFSSGNVKYFGYFNIVNNKLGGHLQVADIQYEADKDTLINNTFKKLTGRTVYVYGDDIFGMEKALLRYGHNHPALKLIRRTTATTEKFNKEK